MAYSKTHQAVAEHRLAPQNRQDWCLGQPRMECQDDYAPEQCYLWQFGSNQQVGPLKQQIQQLQGKWLKEQQNVQELSRKLWSKQ